MRTDTAKSLIRTALLQLIIAHGMSVREYNEVKKTAGLDYQQEKDLAMVDFKLRMYKLSRTNINKPQHANF